MWDTRDICGTCEDAWCGCACGTWEAWEASAYGAGYVQADAEEKITFTAAELKTLNDAFGDMDLNSDVESEGMGDLDEATLELLKTKFIS